MQGLWYFYYVYAFLELTITVCVWVATGDRVARWVVFGVLTAIGVIFMLYSIGVGAHIFTIKGRIFAPNFIVLVATEAFFQSLMLTALDIIALHK